MRSQSTKSGKSLALSALFLLSSGTIPVCAEDSIPVAPTRIRRNAAPSPASSKVLNGVVSREFEQAPSQQSGNGLVSNENMAAFSSAPSNTAVVQNQAPLVQVQQFSTPVQTQTQQTQASAPKSSGGLTARDAKRALEIGLGVASFLGSTMARTSIPRYSSASSFSPYSLGTTHTEPVPTGRQLTRQELALLGNYDVAIVIDGSGSMGTNDCPGGLSRWEWCRNQLLGFTRQTSQVFRQGIDILLFSSEYQAFPNVNYSTVKNIFASGMPNGGTYMAKPLDAVFEEHFRRRDQMGSNKKLLVEVISDGEPSDKGQVAAVISRATQRMRSPDEITVSFLQIGNDRSGLNNLARFDSNLTREGAFHDIVRMQPFSMVVAQGLSHAIVSAARGG